MSATSAEAEAEIRALEAAYDSAWNAGDVESLVSCLRPDAVLVNPRGEVAAGAEEIRQALGGFLRGEAAGSRHESELQAIRSVRSDVAVVDGRVVIRGGALGAGIEHHFTDVLVQEDGRWLISQVRAYLFEG